MQTLKAGGAQVLLCASNPLSTQDDVAASLVKNDKIPVFAIKGENNKTYYKHINAVLDAKPHYHHGRRCRSGFDACTLNAGKCSTYIQGGTEETTTGVIRLKSMAADGVLQYPIIAVNDAQTKHFFDNRYGTGQSTIDGIIRATNRLLAGANFVVCGYGWCGRGLAMRAAAWAPRSSSPRSMRLAALEAVMDGFTVMPIRQAARIGDFFCTVTGNINVIREEHFQCMKDGAIVANSGHFNVELDLNGLAKISKSRRTIRPFVEEYTLANGRRINVLGEGRLINLAAAEGHPSSVMDMSFANQALCIEHMVKSKTGLERAVYPVPQKIDTAIAKEKLAAMGMKIDRLTTEQKKYLTSWTMGT